MACRPQVSAFYVIKNEEEFGPYSIRSIYNAVDEIIVVDNGSTDRTRELLSGFDKVQWFECASDDFSVLKNFAISKCRGEWLLRVDGDEVFYQDIERVLPVLLEYDSMDGYTCRFFNLLFGWDHMQNVDEYDRRFEAMFLFRNKPEIKYVNRVHECLVGLGPKIADSGLHYVHYGYAKPVSVILEKLKQYARRMGEPYFYEGRTEKHLTEQAERRPFIYQHPEAIREYIKRKGYSGGIPKPPVNLSDLRRRIEQIAFSGAKEPHAVSDNKPRSLEIAPLPDCFTAGFEHLDIRPLPHVDIVADIRNMPIPDNTYDEVIVPGYLMEHLPYQDIVGALRECCRVAKEGGRVMVRIYDGRQIATAYAKGEISNESFNKLIFGDDRDDRGRHRCILDNATLCAMMEQAGLENVGLEYYEHWMVQISGRKPVLHAGQLAVQLDLFLPQIGRLKKRE